MPLMTRATHVLQWRKQREATVSYTHLEEYKDMKTNEIAETVKERIQNKIR